MWTLHEVVEGVVEGTAGHEVLGELHNAEESLDDNHAAESVDEASWSNTAQQTWQLDCARWYPLFWKVKLFLSSPNLPAILESRNTVGLGSTGQN